MNRFKLHKPKPLVLVASEHEAKYITYPYIFIIGEKAEQLIKLDITVVYHKGGHSSMILFGGSDMTPIYPLDDIHRLYSIDYVFATHKMFNGIQVKGINGLHKTNVMTSSHSMQLKQEIYDVGRINSTVQLFDMESNMVAYYCQQKNIPLSIVRYVINTCYKRLMPFGLNHFWRKWQHKARQEEFNELMENLCH